MSNQFLRFTLAGGIGFAVDAGVLYLMLWLGTGPYIGRALSFLCAVFVTWQINRRLTFSDAHGKSLIREFGEYLLAMMVGGLCNYAVYALALQLLPTGYAAPLVAVAIGSVAGLLVNFTSARLWVFRPRAGHGRAEANPAPNLPADFQPEVYLELNPDIRAAGVDPVQHYLRFGMREDRRYRRPHFSRRESLPGEPGFVALPLIVISFNRGAMLRRVIDSYLRQSVPVEIAVHDNGSSDPHTLQVLDALEKEGIRVFRRAPIRKADELNKVDESVSAMFATRAPGAYIVTDCDIDLATTSPEAIATYIALLNAFPDIECAGPMLRIDDIRQSYALFGRVMNLHIRQFWHQTPQLLTLDPDHTVACLRAGIDTTFAVHRGGQPFRRLKLGLRVYAPFDARHLDWYPHEFANGSAATTEQYRRNSSSAISHWDNQTYLRDYAAEQPEYDHYVVVTQTADGKPQIVTRSVRDNPS